MKEPNGVVYKGNGNWSDVSNWKGGELPHTQQLPHIHTEECKHEYRAYPKQNGDISTNESFYCIYCLETVSRLFRSFDKVISEKALIDQALHQQSEIIVTWDCAEINDLWVVQFWKKEKDGSLTLIKQIDSGKGSMSLTSLSTEGAK